MKELEFCELERFRGRSRDLPNQAYSYQLYFNLLWRNHNQKGATPDELRAARALIVDPKFFLVPAVLMSSVRRVQATGAAAVVGLYHPVGDIEPAAAEVVQPAVGKR
ncbi:MAG TPA: hypothetical protein VNJ11_11870 [Bryobacteraceae bacterium]|nr:hypothetical protein [Bryobacteraceae bacterium]